MCIHHCLCEHGNFALHVANSGQPTSTTPEIAKDILDILNETPEISTQGISVQVNITHSTVWRALQKQQLYSYLLQCVEA